MVIETRTKTPVVGLMPDTREINFFEADPHLRFILGQRVPTGALEAGLDRLRQLGARLGGEIEDLAAEADQNTPTLRVRDRTGAPLSDVAPSRAYRELERIFYGEFHLAGLSLHVPGDSSTEESSVLNDALMYLGQQVESGLFCPLGMTRSLARTLLKFAGPDVVRSYVPRLASPRMDEFHTGAMFMTEKQSGSDLGIVASVARPATSPEGWWELDGDKWFCSNAGADVILTLARPEGAPTGTRGLGLYLVPRELPDGTRNSYRIERLKDKLGMRSFASGEVTLERTLALQIGGPGEGWHQMTEMLNTTRLACGSGAAALARRSFLEAVTHARGRVAFGKPLIELPLMREQLLDMLIDVEGFTALFFEGSASLERADAGDAVAALLVRVLTPLAKYHISAEARRTVEEGMEVRGGNAYIEEWPNPRLLRDVHVQSIWEGTGNISALDLGRALSHEGVPDTFFAHYFARLDAISDSPVRRAASLASLALTRCQRALSGLTSAGPVRTQARMRDLTHQLAHALTATLLVEEAAAQAMADASYRNLARATRYLRRHIFVPQSGFASDEDQLAQDWLEQLIDWSAMPAAASEALLGAMERETHP
ncbi:MAG TPA: acyl-CoA dehydrogenase family protein [Ktedonobacterales bacterium]